MDREDATQRKNILSITIVKGEGKKEWGGAKGFTYLDDRRTMCTPGFQGLQFCNAL
jgi:hypothetical protein